MHCTPRMRSLVSLVFALGATGALALAIATDYWLWTSEALYSDMLPAEVANSSSEKNFWINAHSGLWRLCIVYDVPDEPVQCTATHYGQQWGRIDGADTTNSIMRANRKVTPILLCSLLVLAIALGVSVVGNTKRDFKTMVAAVLFIFSALGLASGVIVYISSVNVEVSHRRSVGPNGGKLFKYKYGWAFFFAGAAFVATMVAAVVNITLYLSKYSQLEDMALIIPGLEKQAESAGIRRIGEPDHDV